ncbi:DUF397 domain-containing protein [Kitasatospora sp. NPDC101176]|uniref:DUF397 domain-containing protein n=1 Tax=Kitasatospora sp. NPDC101176 TaxID=3364099 RepID=UPI0037F77F0C
MTDTEWQKSSFSGSGGDCVEVRAVGEAIELRESDDAHTILRTTPTTLATLVRAIKNGEYHHHA